MTIDDQIKDKKLRYNINREATKILALSSGKIDKYECLTGEEILPSNQRQIIEQAKFTFSPLGKVFEKQIETIKDQEKKQVEAIKEHGKQLVNSDKDIHNKSHKIFDELSYERMSKINDLSRQINFNNLIYHFKDKSISPINFIGFKASLHL